MAAVPIMLLPNAPAGPPPTMGWQMIAAMLASMQSSVNNQDNNHGLGCFVDNPSRIMENRQPDSAVNTPANCIAACAEDGFDFAGVSYGNECFCSASAPDVSNLAANQDDCSFQCPDDQSLICGGTWRVNIYAVDPNFELPPAPR